MLLGKKTNYKAVEDKSLGFVLVYKLALPSGKEATVLLNVYPVVVSKFDFDGLSNFRRDCYTGGSDSVGVR